MEQGINRTRRRWLTSADAARILACDVKTVRWMIVEGLLPAAPLGRRGVWRIDPADLDAMKRGGPASNRPEALALLARRRGTRRE